MRRASWLTFLVVASCAWRAAPAASPPPPPKGDPSIDALTLALYSKRLDFHRGEPVLPVRLMEGAKQASFSGAGRLRMKLSGEVEKTVEAPAGSSWTVRLASGAPSRIKAWVQLAEVPFSDKATLEKERAAWRGKGLKVRTHTLGSVYGIAGKIIDNRRYLLLVDEPLEPSELSNRQAEILRAHGVRTSGFEEISERSKGILELVDGEGNVAAVAQDLLTVSTVDKAPLLVRQVEFGVGYSFHGFEDRRYRGSLQFTVDRAGKLAVINLVPLEDLMRGLVPSEIFAKAHPEALKAQAVTARGEVLAKIGTRHLADPYPLCAEQHCAVYKGLSGEAATTNAAVEQTRGEGLFDERGRLVDSVYSAVCGGHTENNEAVWGTPPNASLRGRPDLLPGKSSRASPSGLEEFLGTELPAACRLSSFAQPSKFRWERRFSMDEIDALTAGLNIGRVRAITVTERGISGRARLLTLSGEAKATQVRGELNIRKLFGMLNSAMFLVEPARGADGKQTGWLFRGGGWGHGAGLCQTGAIGRAEAGQKYQEILDHYFNGANVSRLY